MKNDIAILLPYKEKFNINKAGAASIWVKDYLLSSKLNFRTVVYGNLEKRDKPLLKNFKNKAECFDIPLTLSRSFMSASKTAFKDLNRASNSFAMGFVSLRGIA